MHLLNPEDCLNCTVYIGESLVEINEGMSKLLDKQVGFMQAIVKCGMEIKEELENDCAKIFLLIGGCIRRLAGL